MSALRILAEVLGAVGVVVIALAAGFVLGERVHIAVGAIACIAVLAVYGVIQLRRIRSGEL